MTTSLIDLDLPEGWSCSVELQQTPEGAYVGKAALRQGHTQRCVLVIAQQLTQEAAITRMKYQAGQFIEDWNSRPASQL
jgi:hypothetical protein